MALQVKFKTILTVAHLRALFLLTPAWEDTDQIIGYFLPKLSVHEHFFHSVGIAV